ncbi:hypothetical protein ACIF80_05480 [Streptomyces sp. NPDC085927]|uniref:hypothetical protein n=1 Tax=Streptomyces sp. NPDC085927 TaxID=3365738 RepID=UPI0037CD0DD0
MRIRTTTVAALTVLALALTACGSGEEPTAEDDGGSRSAGTGAEDAEDRAREAAGLPPEPSTTARYRFLEALDAIDRRISEPGTDELAMSRGLNQCRSIKAFPDDRDKLIRQTLERFAVPADLPDINTPETGGKILDAVHEYLCPDF